MASSGVKRDDRGYPEPPSTGLLAQWVKKARDGTRLTARSSVQAGRRPACFFPSTDRETTHGRGRRSTRMPKENRWTQIPARKMVLRMTSRRRMTSVTTTTRARSGSATKTTPTFQNWDRAQDREPKIDPTRRLGGGLASHLLLTWPDVAFCVRLHLGVFFIPVVALVTPDWANQLLRPRAAWRT